mgnify:CR=1 FL=1
MMLLSRLSHAIAAAAALLAGLILVAMVGHTVLEMTLRAFFSSSTFVLDEFVGYEVAALTMLGLGYALNTGGLLRVNLIAPHLPRVLHRWLELVLVLMVLGLMLLLATYHLDAVIRAYDRNTLSGTLANTPMWIPMGVFLVGLGVFILQLITYALRLLVTGELIETVREDV